MLFRYRSKLLAIYWPIMSIEFGAAFCPAWACSKAALACSSVMSMLCAFSASTNATGFLEDLAILLACTSMYVRRGDLVLSPACAAM